MLSLNLGVQYATRSDGKLFDPRPRICLDVNYRCSRWPLTPTALEARTVGYCSAFAGIAPVAMATAIAWDRFMQCSL